MTGFLLFLLAVAVAGWIGQKRQCWRLGRERDVADNRCLDLERELALTQSELLRQRAECPAVALRREAQESF